jgi:dihydrofolate reductase
MKFVDGGDLIASFLDEQAIDEFVVTGRCR